jgi:hypothetical protein
MEIIFKNIENYVDSLHMEKVVIEPIVTKIYSNSINEPLEIKILKQRMDSVNVIKYYKDLKNNRIKAEPNSEILNSVEEMNDFIVNNMNKKPWPKMDKFTKNKKIELFVDKLVKNGKISELERKIVVTELKTLLDNKKINTKNLELDDNNDIIKLDKYTLT